MPRELVPSAVALQIEKELALERGKVAPPYTPQKRNGWLHSLAAYLGGETPLGPVYLGLGFGSGRSTNAYLFIGTP